MLNELFVCCRNSHCAEFQSAVAANDKRLQESSARIAEQEKELANIEKLFLSGIVTPENAAYWNAKLFETRHALEQSRRDHSALETSLSAPLFPGTHDRRDSDSIKTMVGRIRSCRQFPNKKKSRSDGRSRNSP